MLREQTNKDKLAWVHCIYKRYLKQVSLYCKKVENCVFCSHLLFFCSDMQVV